jgi:PrcB C-terminal
LISGFRDFGIAELVVVALAAAVGGQGAAPRTVDKGDRSQIMSAREVIVRTAAEWDALWRSHLPTRQAAAVDFSKEMVVGVFLGSRPTPGYGVTIVSASEEGNVLRVRYRETSPPSDAILAQVITFPYQIVAIPKSAATDVTFEKIK